MFSGRKKREKSCPPKYFSVGFSSYWKQWRRYWLKQHIGRAVKLATPTEGTGKDEEKRRGTYRTREATPANRCHKAGTCVRARKGSWGQSQDVTVLRSIRTIGAPRRSAGYTIPVQPPFRLQWWHRPKISSGLEFFRKWQKICPRPDAQRRILNAAIITLEFVLIRSLLVQLPPSNREYCERRT